jgi:hypothetical protein
MKRYPAFDPPEYVSWSADPALLQEFGKTIGGDPARRDVIATLPREAFLLLYERLLLARLQDIAVAVGSAGRDLEGLVGDRGRGFHSRPRLRPGSRD